MVRYALVIGIAEYDDSLYEASFDFLSKATQDADAVAEKLKKDGKYKVTKLSNNVKGSDLYKGLKNFLHEEAKQGEALIYFTGHGFQVVDSFTGEKKESCLAASDSTVTVRAGRITAQDQGISFEILNDLIEQSNLSSLVVLLDACHSGGFIDSSRISKSLQVFKSENRNYCFIASCKSHQSAEVEKREDHSVFTKALLDGLSRKNSDPETGEITAARLFEFIYRELEESNQEPVAEYKGRPIVVVDYPPLYQQRPADAIPSEEIESLFAILQLEELSKLTQQVYLQCLPNPWLGSKASELRMMLKQLNEEFPRKDGKLPLFDFVQRLIAASNLPEAVPNKLQTWLSNTAQKYGIALAPSSPIAPPPVNPYLLVRLKPSRQQENHFFVKAWFFLDDQSKAEYSQFKPLCSQRFPEEQAYSFDDISELLDDFLEQTLRELKDTDKQPIIEFFLPKDSLSERVEQLTVLDAIGEAIPIGTDFQVIVRSHERLTRRYRERAGIDWRNKWNQAKQLSPPFPQNLFERLFHTDGLNWDRLRASLVDKIGLQIACSPLAPQSAKSKASSSKRDLIGALLSTAIPVAIWTRCPVSEAVFLTTIDELFNAGALSELPECVRKKRLEAIQQQVEDHIGQHLVLLWEDPERLPPDEETLEFQTA